MATNFAPTVQSLDAKIADLQNRARNNNSSYNPGNNINDEISRLMNQRNAMVQGQASSVQQSEDARMQAAREKIRELTEGRADELRNDAVMGKSTDFLQAVLSGQEMPFSQSVQSGILSQNAQGAATVEQAQMQALQDAIQASGGSIYDPSFQAKKAELMAQRQGANLDAQGKLATQAGLANYDAKAGAAGNLAAIRSNQNAQINQMGLAGAGFRAQEFADVNQRPVQQPQQQQQQQNPYGAMFSYLQQSQQQQQPQQRPAPMGPPAPVKRPGTGNPIALQPGYVQVGYKPGTGGNPSNFVSLAKPKPTDPYAGYY